MNIHEHMSNDGEIILGGINDGYIKRVGREVALYRARMLQSKFAAWRK